MKNSSSIKRFKTFFWLLAITSLAFFLRWLPTFWAYLKKDHKIFLGINTFFQAADIWVYLAAVLEGKKGHLLFVNQFGSGPQGKFFLYPPYLFLGHLARLFDLSPEIAYFLGSYFSSLALALSLYLLSTIFFKKKLWRLLTLASALFSGPLNSNLTLQSAPFLSLLFPHYLLAQTSLVLAFFSFLKIEKTTSAKKRKLLIVFIFLSGLILSLIHIFISGLIITIALLWLLISSVWEKDFWQRSHLLKKVVPLAAFIIATLPMLVYFFTLSRSYLFSSIFIDRNILPAPPVSKNLFQFIIVFPLIPFALKKAQQNRAVFFLFTWLIVQFLFLYFPVRWQVRFSQGSWIPVSFLAVLGFSNLSRQLEKKTSSLSWLVACLIVGPLTAFNLGVILLETLSFASKEEITYVSRQETQAWEFLKIRCQFSTVLLSDPTRGIYLPAKTGCRSFIGHGIQTFDYYQKLSQVEKVLSGEMAKPEIGDFLEKEEITYVFLPQQEAQKAGFQKLENLKSVFKNEKFVIYERATIP
jgi:hypothetical protein